MSLTPFRKPRINNTLTRLACGLLLLFLTSNFAYAKKPELVVQTGHSSGIERIAYSHDGKLIATVGDTTIRLWESATGRLLRVIQRESGAAIESLVFSPMGHALAAAVVLGDRIESWDVRSGKSLVAIAIKGSRINTICFDAGGELLLGGRSDGSLTVWRAETGEELRTIQVTEPVEAANARIDSIAPSPDGTTVAVRSLRGVRLVDTKEWKQANKTIEIFGYGSVAFSPDSQLLAVGSNYTTTFLVKAATGEVLKKLRGPSSTTSVTGVSFSSDGQHVVAVYDGNVKGILLWSVSDGRQMNSIVVDFTGWAVSPSGRTVAVASVLSQKVGVFESNRIKAVGEIVGGLNQLDASDGHVLSSTKEFIGRINSFVPDGKGHVWGTVVNPDGTLTSLEFMGGMRVGRLNAHMGKATSESYSSDGKTMVVSFNPPDPENFAELKAENLKSQIQVWDVSGGREIRTILTDPYVRVPAVACSRDGRLVASYQEVGLGTTYNYVELTDVASGDAFRSIEVPLGKRIEKLLFSPGGETLLGVGRDNSLTLWDVKSGKEIGGCGPATTYFHTLTYSPDGASFITSSANSREIKWRDARTGQLQQTAEILRPGWATFSPDGKLLAVADEGGGVTVYDVHDRQLTARQTLQLNAPRFALSVSGFSPDSRLMFIRSGHAFLLWDLDERRALAQVIATGDYDWLVITPDGLFDGSPAAWGKASWRFNENIYDMAPAEAFFNEYYYPGLLPELLEGRRPAAPKEVAHRDRRQAELKISTVEGRAVVRGGRQTVAVKLEVSNAPAGARDVRLFRNGSLVKRWEGDVLKGKETVSMTATVPIIAGDNTFTAYAFNNDNVKSADAAVTVIGGESLKRKGIAHVLAIGVDKYANPAYNLSYSVADAKAFGEEISRWQQQLGRFERTDVKMLLDEQGTKANILAALQQIKEKAQPEDAVMIYFAGHGTAEGKRFYLIPHDLGYKGARDKITKNAVGLRTMLQHSISDRELEEAVRGIDAGQMLFVIDACNSGQALEAEEKRRGPMNSAGLAQLAYEKGMYILTASQSYQFANESPVLGHGYLTYALVEKGLKSAAADANKDGVVDVREWFVYATEEVPRIYEDQMKKQSASKLAQLRARKRDSGLDGIDDVQRPRVFYRREVELQPLIVAKPTATVSN